MTRLGSLGEFTASPLLAPRFTGDRGWMALDTTSRGTADALVSDPPDSARGSGRPRKLLRWSVAAVLVAALVGGTAWSFLGRGDSSEATDAVAGAQLLEVTSGTFGETVSAEGTVEAAETEELAFTSSGTVTAVNVAAGDTVTAGQVLATIDSAELESALAAAQADLADAEAELDTAEQSGSSDEQLDLAEASVATAQDAVESAFEALAGATLSASVDGLVTSVDLTVGEDLGASGTGGTTVTGSGTGSGLTSSQLGTSDTAAGAAAPGENTAAASDPQIQIVSAGDFLVDLSVGTADVDLIEVGQEVTLSISTDSDAVETRPGGFGFGSGGGVPGGFGAGGVGGAPGANTTQNGDGAPTETTAALTAVGTVSEVSGVADASSGVATFTVSVAFSDDSGDIWAGSSATAEINVGARQDVTQVSSAAVSTTDGVSTVTVALEGTLEGATEEREVVTGETSGRVTEIIEGLRPGDQVIVENLSFAGGRLGGSAPGGREIPEGFEPPAGGGFPGASADAEAGS